jgi:hypothetical protein
MPKTRVRRRLLPLGATGLAIAVIVSIALGVLVGSALGRALSR